MRVAATDDGSPPRSSTATFAITVAPAANNPPAPPALSNQSATPGRAFSYRFGAIADPGGDTVSDSAALSDGGALPGWLAFDAAGRRRGNDHRAGHRRR